ncbi:hypothetical protein, partial [Xanthobacter versatilis]|uniref:hypothetical protein n=1 Tax=Xanthobacter autotrophicus (strain ATCC BAA-1158 / Py2) TaxID=78245 RepID=UPI00372721B1
LIHVLHITILFIVTLFQLKLLMRLAAFDGFRFTRSVCGMTKAELDVPEIVLRPLPVGAGTRVERAGAVGQGQGKEQNRSENRAGGNARTPVPGSLHRLVPQ